jgi:hypothetical protein
LLRNIRGWWKLHTIYDISSDCNVRLTIHDHVHDSHVTVWGGLRTTGISSK